MNLVGKRALVTGAARRIGAAISRRLAEAGCDLVLHYNRSSREVKALAQELREFGVDVETIRAALEKEQDVLALAKKSLRRGPIDILINNASLYFPTPFKKIRSSDWDRMMDVNLKTPFLLSQKLGEKMRRRGGRIINISDASGEWPYENFLPYCVSKGAVLILTRALALELAPKVQVTSISPGPIVPATWEAPRIKKLLARKSPLKKWGGEEEVVKAVLFLCESDYTTGTNLVIDGGIRLV